MEKFLTTLKLGRPDTLYDFITENGSENMLHWRTKDDVHYYEPFITNSQLDFGINFSHLYVEPIQNESSENMTEYLLHSTKSDLVYNFSIVNGKIDFTYMRYLTVASYIAEQYLSLLKNKDASTLADFLIQDDLIYGEDKAKILLDHYYQVFNFNTDIKVEYVGANSSYEFNFIIRDESVKKHPFIIRIGEGIPDIHDTMGPDIND